MLDEQAYAPVAASLAEYDSLLHEVESGRHPQEEGERLLADARERLYECMSATYQAVTGQQARDPYHVAHHRASLYGPPCASCGKVLRTPKASKCFECGQAKT